LSSATNLGTQNGASAGEGGGPGFGAGGLAVEEVVGLVDEEALGLGDHLQAVVAEPASDALARPPGQRRGTLHPGVVGRPPGGAPVEVVEPLPQALALGVGVDG
jgi:hypothetical protein